MACFHGKDASIKELGMQEAEMNFLASWICGRDLRIMFDCLFVQIIR